MSYLLLTEQASNTDGNQATLMLGNTLSYSKYFTVVAYGTWDGATTTVKFSPDGGTTWISYGTTGTFTSDGFVNIYLNPDIDMLIRGDVTSAGDDTSLNSKIFY